MSQRSGLKPMPLASVRALTSGPTSDVAIYLPQSSREEPVLYRQRGMGMSQPDFERLRDAGVSILLVHAEDLSKCEEALEERLSELLRDPEISAAEKAACVQHVGTSVVREVLRKQVDRQSVARATRVLDVVIDGILSDTAVAEGLLHMSGHHRTTASHMFAVSTLAILLGVEVCGPDQASLKELGLAGMLHDLGKMMIDPTLLNTTRPLTPAEVRLIRHHPIETIRLIGDDPAVTTHVRQMILQHHERYDGRGYPLGLAGNDLLTGSRILAIVDSFHALVGRREYREAIDPKEAEERLRFEKGRQFDPDLYGLWEGLFRRCHRGSWPDLNAPEVEAEVGCSFHVDHRPAPKQLARRRTVRVQCGGRSAVKCLYVGRLPAATTAPGDFVSPLHDVSRAGLCMYTTYPMYCGEVVHLLIDSTGGRTWLRGVIRWCQRETERARYRTGVQFEARIPESEAALPQSIRTVINPESQPASQEVLVATP